MIKDVLRSLAGILMTAVALVIVLAVIAVFIGITTHNLLSMLALASVLAVIAAGLQWLLQVIPQCDEQKYPGPNNPREVLDQKQNIHFDPWTDEWYGTGPWWKKW